MLSPLILSACASLTSSSGRPSPPPASAFCQAFPPIRWSPSDTDETLRQVKLHNAAWKSLCRPA